MLSRRLLPKAALIICIATIPAVQAQQIAGPTDDEIDAGISRALQSLARAQRPGGAWQTDEHGDSTAATSLAVMAFMAAGHLPGEGPYGEQLERAVFWVISQQGQDDMLVGQRRSHGPMYSHGIATLMLAEVLGMMDDETVSRKCRKALERALKVILKAQDVPKASRHAGGWRYEPHSRNSDLSVTGWQLLALRAAKDVGCDVPAENIDRAVRYIRRLSVKGNHGFGYEGPHGATPTRAGTGILALEICGRHHSAEALGAADYLIERPLHTKDSYFYYGVYYCTIGLFKIGGDYWERSRPRLFRTILNEQRRDGSWFTLHGSERRYGPIYATSMAVLALAVEYRFLPIYQR